MADTDRVGQGNLTLVGWREGSGRALAAGSTEWGGPPCPLNQRCTEGTATGDQEKSGWGRGPSLIIGKGPPPHLTSDSQSPQSRSRHQSQGNATARPYHASGWQFSVNQCPARPAQSAVESAVRSRLRTADENPQFRCVTGSPGPRDPAHSGWHHCSGHAAVLELPQQSATPGPAPPHRPRDERRLNTPR
ncbi:hypothetical protein NDU88_006020 [Pleurodeles waltl]|uniref:Uncharacterized protein n=1 Tax=Pleurodeles waltl TaxID=8319 RepID=A0AAV7PLB0_PLEWA|nr:hypothetical protein NDU88_006020 [Pleurodeles waltl]